MFTIDPWPLARQRLEGELRQHEHRREVDVDHPAELVGRLGLGRARVGGAGVVDEDVEPAPDRDGLVDEAAAVGIDGDVALDRVGPLAELGDERVEAVGAPRGRQHDGGAGRVQHLGEARPQPGRGAGDDGHPAVEAERREHVDRHRPDPRRRCGAGASDGSGASGT